MDILIILNCVYPSILVGCESSTKKGGKLTKKKVHLLYHICRTVKLCHVEEKLL